MAFREPEILLCPSCGLSGAVTWVVDEGPDGAGGHRYLLEAGPWRNMPRESLPDWRGRLICPTCDVVVKQLPAPHRERREKQPGVAMRDMPIDIAVNVVLILPLVGWLMLSAATNLPFPPGAFGAAESWLWPLAVLVACLAYVVAFARDMLHGGRRHSRAAFLPALVLGTFALRVAFAPFDPGLPPDAMTGLPEGLAVFTAIFALYGLATLAISLNRGARA